MPLPELQQRLNNFTSLDLCYGELHASPKDVQRLLVQLHDEEPRPALSRTCSAPGTLRNTILCSLRSSGWRRWAVFVGLNPRQHDDSGGKSLPARCFPRGSAAAQEPTAAAHLGRTPGNATQLSAAPWPHIDVHRARYRLWADAAWVRP